MKNQPTHLHLLLAAGLTVLAFTACTKSDRETAADKTSAAYEGAKDSMAKGWDNLKSYTFEKRDAFTADVKLKQAQIDAQLSELKANYAEDKASASRKAAMDELKSSEADYKEKLSALGSASADTWDAARDNVAAAWDHLQVSYAKARAAN